MATSVVSLIDRVRDLLDDYGVSRTTLAAAVSDTTGTTFSVADQSVAAVGDWATVDGETAEITAVADGSPDTFTVVRGSRGSTAATHSNGAIVRINLDIPPTRVLNALNMAQAAAYPMLSEIVTDTTLAVVANQYDYTRPSTLDHVRQVWIETGTSDDFIRTRNWDMSKAGVITLYETLIAGRNIKVVGTKRFDDMTYSGNVDSLYPTTDSAAIGYLVYEAAATLVSEQQFVVAKRDGFKGITDSFQATAPTISLAVGERYHQIAQRYLRAASRSIVLPEEDTPDPNRVYLRMV
jgi:hypothetical protein